MSTQRIVKKLIILVIAGLMTFGNVIAADSAETAKSLGCFDVLKKIKSQGYRNNTTGFGFSFDEFDGKFKFIFGGPDLAGGALYDVIDCGESQNGMKVKVKFGDEESIIQIHIINANIVRLTPVKNFSWGIDTTGDYVKVR